MNIRTAGKAALAALALSTTPFLGALPAQAEPTAAVKAEIDHLIAFVGDSGCEFYRNGSWYDGKRGQSHISDKYTWLLGRDLIQTTGDFIDRAATQSSMSSQAYKVRCNGGEPVESAKWLNEELTRFRALAKAPAGVPGTMAIATGTKSGAGVPAVTAVAAKASVATTPLVATPAVKVN